MGRNWIAVGCINAVIALAVAAAFGHRPEGMQMSVAWANIDTARDLHLIHGLALVGLGLFLDRFGALRWATAAAWVILAGILFFCFVIYLRHALDLDILRFVVPVGGVLLMLGWVLFAVAALTLRQPAPPR